MNKVEKNYCAIIENRKKGTKVRLRKKYKVLLHFSAVDFTAVEGGGKQFRAPRCKTATARKIPSTDDFGQTVVVVKLRTRPSITRAHGHSAARVARAFGIRGIWVSVKAAAFGKPGRAV